MDTEHAHDSDDAKPLQLLSVDDDGTFNVNEDACDALRRIDTPVGVVAVCGRARQGKSYLLNALLGRSAGFTVSPRQKPCTKGIWMPHARCAAWKRFAAWKRDYARHLTRWMRAQTRFLPRLMKCMRSTMVRARGRQSTSCGLSSATVLCATDFLAYASRLRRLYECS